MEMTDEQSDRIVYGATALAVLIMLVGLIGFPLAGKYALSTERHSTEHMQGEITTMIAQREFGKRR